MSRLFHSLVVCGAGLTLLDCGGRSVERAPSDEPAHGGQAPTAGAGGGSSGAPATGGVSPISGIPPDLGGSPTQPQGGSVSVAGAGGAVSPDAAHDRWSCTTELVGCVSGFHDGYPVEGFQIAMPCQPDPKRPTSSADCGPQGSLDCAVGFFNGTTVLFNCECNDKGPSEMCHCPDAHSSCFSATNVHYCDEHQTVCGCAMTCIAK